VFSPINNHFTIAPYSSGRQQFTCATALHGQEIIRNSIVKLEASFLIGKRLLVAERGIYVFLNIHKFSREICIHNIHTGIPSGLRTRRVPGR
jgi:hypothetical protein